MGKILVIDDDPTLCSMLVTRLESSGHVVESALSLSQGFDFACAGDFDIVLLDVQLPDGNGLEYLSNFTAVDSEPEMIIMTGNGDPDGAKKAIASGAWDYLEKPHVIKNLLLPVTRALQYRKEKFKNASNSVALKRDRIIGESSAIGKCLDKVAQAANSNAALLITGETGTGKEVFASTVHANSKKADGKFTIVDCASLPEKLIESILFGYVKGAFTGADENSQGLVSQADGGTLFLDEVGELPLDTQKKLLRVLQERRYRAVGSIHELTSDFRIIAATNKDLSERVNRGVFRSDLLFRLRSLSIELPPLRERAGDIPLLIHHILSALLTRNKMEPKVVSSEFIAYLEAYNWPGNVRELQQVLEQVLAGASGYDKIFAYHLPEHIRINGSLANLAEGKVENSGKTITTVGKSIPWRQFKMKMEAEYMEQLMAHTDGNIKKACTLSGLSRARLYQLLKR